MMDQESRPEIKEAGVRSSGLEDRTLRGEIGPCGAQTRVPQGGCKRVEGIWPN